MTTKELLDLYTDLYTFFITIRFQAERKDIPVVLDAILKRYDTGKSLEIRNALVTEETIDQNFWKFDNLDKRYYSVKIKPKQQERCIYWFALLLKKIRQLWEKGDYKTIFRLTDDAHNIPVNLIKGKKLAVLHLRYVVWKYRL